MNFNDNYFKTLNFIKTANIMLATQFDLFCEKNKITDSQKGNIIKTLTNKRELFIDESKTFYMSSPNMNYSNFTTALEKTIWFYVSNCDKYTYCNFSPKPPASAYMCGNTDEEFSELTVFYIPEGTEKIQSRIIETNYGSMPSKVPTALIFPNENGLNDMYLSDVFDLKKVAIIDAKGNIKELN